ncbi:hypothetical protein THF1C08_210090 [Vibrio jasicida]|uniref:Uncharacterized protein n=1 Tax=Vibrio jasicida TaxID=766224 RepID=A0AAU9QLF1_9VIBR|nr:hypothetical protein THF1C08_210090 [Vibrio jasicida]CAH1590618.1 hypothetical protein THF1A12_220089 [Vibrio jasicida]
MVIVTSWLQYTNSCVIPIPERLSGMLFEHHQSEQEVTDFLAFSLIFLRNILMTITGMR